MIENQEELRMAVEQNREQKKQIKELEAQILKLDGLPSEHNDKLVELQTHVRLSGCFSLCSIHGQEDVPI